MSLLHINGLTENYENEIKEMQIQKQLISALTATSLDTFRPIFY